jgi:hypothetical protein
MIQEDASDTSTSMFQSGIVTSNLKRKLSFESSSKSGAFPHGSRASQRQKYVTTVQIQGIRYSVTRLDCTLSDNMAVWATSSEPLTATIHSEILVSGSMKNAYSVSPLFTLPCLTLIAVMQCTLGGSKYVAKRFFNVDGHSAAASIQPVPNDINLKHLKDELLRLTTAKLILESFINRAEKRNTPIFGMFIPFFLSRKHLTISQIYVLWLRLYSLSVTATIKGFHGL